MSSPHRLADARVVAATSLAPRQVAELVAGLASAEPTVAAAVRLVDGHDGRLRFAIRMFRDTAETMSFHVDVLPDGTGSRVRSKIDTYTTTQEKLFMLVPIGPRQMVSYPVYKLFMNAVRESLGAADPRAEISIVEVEQS